jgi:ribosomal protein L7/L12
MIEYTLLVVFVTAFVLAVFWFVAKTIGKLRVVKNSTTLDDIRDFINPELAEERSHAQEEKSRRSESLSLTVRALADAGDKLGATKMYKQETGFSLMESKKTVEAHMSNRSDDKRRTRADEP